MSKRTGRPSLFNEALKERMLKLYEEGKTDEEVAWFVGVSVTTLNNWKKKNPDFLTSLKESKAVADDLVEASLFQRATGYSHKEEKTFLYKGEVITHETIKHYPPDTTAQIFWLKNRRPDLWREKQPGEDDKTIKLLSEQSPEEMDRRIKELLKKDEE